MSRVLMESLLESMEQIEEDNDVRRATKRIYEYMDDGILDPRTVAEACMSYMSESEVADMANANDWFMYDEEEY